MTSPYIDMLLRQMAETIDLRIKHATERRDLAQALDKPNLIDQYTRHLAFLLKVRADLDESELDDDVNLSDDDLADSLADIKARAAKLLAREGAVAEEFT